MRFELRFPIQIATTLGIVALVVAYPLARYASGEVILGVVLGALLCTINVLLGFAAIEYSLERSYSVFLRTVLGGMGVRLVLMLAMLAVVVMYVPVQTTALMLSVFGFYLVFLILEVLFIQRKMLAKQSG